MRYGEGLLEEILRRTDLVQLVGRRVKLERKGPRVLGPMPVPQRKIAVVQGRERAPHLSLFRLRAGGSAFKWLQETEALSFPEAVQKLAEEAGVELPALDTGR
jgi:DNA primase